MQPSAARAAHAFRKLPMPLSMTEVSRGTHDHTYRPDNIAPALTVIVPTRNESQNVEPLLSRFPLPSPRRLWCSSSTTVTTRLPTSSKRLGHEDSDRLRCACCIVRPLSVPAGWAERSSPVWRRQTTPWVCVMDGDLQHPPECVAGPVTGHRPPGRSRRGQSLHPRRPQRRPRRHPDRRLVGLHRAGEAVFPVGSGASVTR